MSFFYAIQEKDAGQHRPRRLLKFTSQKKRDAYCRYDDYTSAISAAEAKKEQVADTWKGYSNREVDCVFFAAAVL